MRTRLLLLLFDLTGSVKSTRSVANFLFSVEDVLRYLVFCKVFKPKMSKDASEFVVQEYKVILLICKY